MCIRDSHIGVAGGEGAQNHVGQFPGNQIVHLVGTQRGIVAVSYTHLRAHETVLDLVCRLLLDKKKSQRKQPHYEDLIKH